MAVGRSGDFAQHFAPRLRLASPRTASLSLGLPPLRLQMVARPKSRQCSVFSSHFPVDFETNLNRTERMGSLQPVSAIGSPRLTATAFGRNECRSQNQGHLHRYSCPIFNHVSFCSKADLRAVSQCFSMLASSRPEC
jgi:hypothetical protein